MNYDEQLSFSLCLQPTFTKTAPVVEIFNNDTQLLPKTEIHKTTTIELCFKTDPSTPNSVLRIVRTNHDEVNSQQLKLAELSVDGINLEKILYHSEYYPQYPATWLSEELSQGRSWPAYHKGWLEWGWNGTWCLPYTVPFYTWLLKSL
jgi:hypothetical protein